MTCTEEAKKELKENARPRLNRIQKDSPDCDNIFILGPCWRGTHPCAVFTRLETLDFSRKKVFPMMTHEGSGLAGHGNEAGDSEKEAAAWAKMLVG